MKRHKHTNDIYQPQNVVDREHAAAHYAQQRQAHTRKRVFAGIGVALLAIVTVAAVAIALYIHGLNQALNSGVSDDLRAELTSAGDGKPFYMLLLGVDKSQERVDSGGFGSDSSAYRSDTIILARVDPANHKVTLVSIPRDTKVDMGEYGTQKINAAYSLGGPTLVTKVVSRLAGVSISHYAEIDFDQFSSVVDTIGGVTVNLPVAISDAYANIELPAGEQTLNGEQALGLVRSRHAYDSYGAGDFYRESNQRMVIGAIIHKVLQLDMGTMVSTVTTISKSVTTDMNVQTILGLAVQMRDLNVDSDIYSGMVPTDSQYIGGISYQVVNEAGWKTMMERVDSGQSPYADASEDVTAGVAGSVGGYSSESTSNSTSSDGADNSGSTRASGKVAVLNATTVDGLAARVAKTLAAAGYTTSADTAQGSARTTTIYYNGEAGKAQADTIAQLLGGNIAIAKNDSAFSSDYTCIVVLGADKSDL